MVKVLLPKERKEKVLLRPRVSRKPLGSVVKKTAKLWYGKVRTGKTFVKNIRKEWAI